MAKNKKIPRAGLIPYHHISGNLHIMLMRPSNSKFGGDEFQVAKGKIEIGETPEEAAIREASEELGLKPHNVINVTYLGTFLGYTEVFYGQILDVSDFGETTHETAETIWMPPDKFLEVGRKIHRPIIKAFLSKL